MKKVIFVFVIAFIFNISVNTDSKGQSIEIVGGNMLNGALTGSILGVATMGLQDDSGFGPLRIGLGSGILAGAGIAVYDITTLPQGQQLFISGTFNDGNNSSIIILLDTVYGASIGAALGAAVVLISNDSLLDGLQYGTSVGAWTGFGFGLIDSFILAERNRDLISQSLNERNGIFSYKNNGYELGLLKPELFAYTNLSGKNLSIDIQPAVSLISLKKSF